MSDAAVIVPTLLGGPRLVRLLESLAVGGDHPVLVVDNASSDPGLAALNSRFRGVEVLRLAENRGFGRAINLAAQRTDAPTIVVLNDDCVCDPGFVEAIASAIAPAAHVVMAAGVMRYQAEPSLIDTAGIQVDRTLAASDYLHGEPLTRLRDDVASPLGPAGVAAAYDRETFLATGGFDGALFAYLEDVDLALRMRIDGGRCALAPDAVGTHEHSGTLGPGSTRKNYLAGFGRGYLLRKWGVVSPARAPAILLREAGVCAAQALFDRNLGGLRGRVKGFREAELVAPYPAAVLAESPQAPNPLREAVVRFARRRRGALADRQGNR